MYSVIVGAAFQNMGIIPFNISQLVHSDKEVREETRETSESSAADEV
jgi:hypothetical protein